MGKQNTRKNETMETRQVQGLTELEKLVENSVSQAHFVLGQVSTKRECMVAGTASSLALRF